MPRLKLVLIEVADASPETVDRLLAIYTGPPETHSGARPNQRSALAPAKAREPSTQEDEGLGTRLRAAIVAALREGPRTNSQIREYLSEQHPGQTLKTNQINWQLKQLRLHNQVRLIRGRKWELV